MRAFNEQRKSGTHAADANETAAVSPEQGQKNAQGHKHGNVEQKADAEVKLRHEIDRAAEHIRAVWRVQCCKQAVQAVDVQIVKNTQLHENVAHAAYACEVVHLPEIEAEQKPPQSLHARASAASS